MTQEVKITPDPGAEDPERGRLYALLRLRIAQGYPSPRGTYPELLDLTEKIKLNLIN